MSAPKLCIDCAHCGRVPSGYVALSDRVMQFPIAGKVTCLAATGLKLDVVSGSMGFARDSDPYTCRNSELLCGAEGKWFEPKGEAA